MARVPAAYRTWFWKVPSPLPSNTDTSLESVVGDGQVGAAVAVEVPRHEGDWPGPRRVQHLVLEGAVAVAQQHRHVVGAVVGDGQVGAAVAVEVPRHEGVWPGPRRVRTWSWKVPSPLPSNTDTSLEP